MSVKGEGGFAKKLDSLGKLPDDISDILFVAAGLIETEARLSITQGSVSGKGHVPSKPGEPPNNDTGVLANSIEAKLTSPTTAEVTASAPYAAVQEYGNKEGTLEERPYMRPAQTKEGPKFKKLIQTAVKRRVNGG